MFLQLRKHDGATNEIDILENGNAREIATSFDWVAERRWFEQLEKTGAECYLPSVSFMDDATRTLEFGPNADGAFWVSYRYSTMKSSFGFYAVDFQCEQQLPACAFETALQLLELHYAGKHEEIVEFLPPQNGPGDEISSGASVTPG